MHQERVVECSISAELSSNLILIAYKSSYRSSRQIGVSDVVLMLTLNEYVFLPCPLIRVEHLCCSMSHHGGNRSLYYEFTSSFILNFSIFFSCLNSNICWINYITIIDVYFYLYLSFNKKIIILQPLQYRLNLRALWSQSTGPLKIQFNLMCRNIFLNYYIYGIKYIFERYGDYQQNLNDTIISLTIYTYCKSVIHF